MESFVNPSSPYWTDLQARGYCVVRNVIPQQECRRMRDEIVRRVQETACEGEDPCERPDLLQRCVGARENFICQHYGIGHLPAVWEARLAAKKVFAELWSTDELVTSMDGICLAPATRTSRRPPDYTWWHTDQNGATHPGLQCVQGLLTLNAMGSEDLTLGVLEGSHLLHSDFAAEHAPMLRGRGHFVSLNDELYRWYTDRGCRVKRIEAGAGDLVLWDSRTVHCSLQPLPTPPGKTVLPQERLVVYVCMLPKARCPTADLRARIAAFEGARLTAHSPYPTTLFPVDPKRRGCEPPRRWVMSPAEVASQLAKNDAIRQLVGYPKAALAAADACDAAGRESTHRQGDKVPPQPSPSSPEQAAVKKEKRWKVKGG